MNKLEDTEEYKNDFRKEAIYLSVYLLEKKIFFFKCQFYTFKRLRCKDSLKRTFGEHVFKEKKGKEKERNIVN